MRSTRTFLASISVTVYVLSCAPVTPSLFKGENRGVTLPAAQTILVTSEILEKLNGEDIYSLNAQELQVFLANREVEMKLLKSPPQVVFGMDLSKDEVSEIEFETELLRIGSSGELYRLNVTEDLEEETWEVVEEHLTGVKVVFEKIDFDTVKSAKADEEAEDL